MSDKPADPRREAIRDALQRRPEHRVIPVTDAHIDAVLAELDATE